MILSSKGEGALCSQVSGLSVARALAVSQILDALRACDINGYRAHGWYVDKSSIEPVGLDVKFGIQFRAYGLMGKPVLQILLNTETGLADICAGKLQRKTFAGRKIGERVALRDLIETINRQFAVGGEHHD